MTQIELARQGMISREMQCVAQKEGLEPELVRDEVARGRMIIPANKIHLKKGLEPMGIGLACRCKINANIGNSAVTSEIDGELEKLRLAVKFGSDTVMDLSTGGNIDAIRQAIIDASPVPIGTVPIYQVIQQIKRVEDMTPRMMLDMVEHQARQGVDYMTLHAGSEVWLFLDTHRGVHFSRQPAHADQPPIDDLLVAPEGDEAAALLAGICGRITASLAHYFIGQRRAVGLVTASFSNYTVISAERSERQEAKILEELAFLQSESTYTLPTLVTAQMGQLPQGSTAVLVTPMVWSELLMAVDSLQRRKLRPVVILLMIESFGSRTNNEELAPQLLQRSVPVCKIYCDADLSETLSVVRYEDLTPEPIELPPRKEDKSGYIRPPITDQTFVPEIY